MIMNGFELRDGGCTRGMAVEDGLVVIHIFYIRGEARIVARGRDHRTGQRICWVDKTIESGDEIRIRFTGIGDCSVPGSVSVSEKSRQQGRLEAYRRLERILTEKGVL